MCIVNGTAFSCIGMKYRKIFVWFLELSSSRLILHKVRKRCASKVLETLLETSKFHKVARFCCIFVSRFLDIAINPQNHYRFLFRLMFLRAVYAESSFYKSGNRFKKAVIVGEHFPKTKPFILPSSIMGSAASREVENTKAEDEMLSRITLAMQHENTSANNPVKIPTPCDTSAQRDNIMDHESPMTDQRISMMMNNKIPTRNQAQVVTAAEMDPMVFESDLSMELSDRIVSDLIKTQQELEEAKNSAVVKDFQVLDLRLKVLELETRLEE